MEFDRELRWPEVQKGLLESVLPITVKAVNQRTGAASLDYANHRELGLRVIAVGGNSLSRGLERRISISGEGLESTRLRSNKKVITANKQCVLAFLQRLKSAGIEQQRSFWKNPIWKSVPRELIVSLLRNFEVHPLNIAFQPDDLAEYFSKTTEEKLYLWDVVMPNGSEPAMNFADVEIRPEKRFVLPRDNGILVSGRNMRVGSRGIEREGLPEVLVREIDQKCKEAHQNVSDRFYRERRSRPLLLIHVIAPYTKDKAEAFDPGPDELIALGLSLPQFDDSDVAKKVKYRVNLVEWRAMLEEAIDDDLPEDEDVAG